MGSDAPTQRFHGATREHQNTQHFTLIWRAAPLTLSVTITA
ncbi:MAG: hypothetical protein ACTS8S_09005 [Giesbergeria sp.]